MGIPYPKSLRSLLAAVWNKDLSLVHLRQSRTIKVLLYLYSTIAIIELSANWNIKDTDGSSSVNKDVHKSVYIDGHIIK
jgi:hypothetical protein